MHISRPGNQAGLSDRRSFDLKEGDGGGSEGGGGESRSIVLGLVTMRLVRTHVIFLYRVQHVGMDTLVKKSELQDVTGPPRLYEQLGPTSKFGTTMAMGNFASCAKDMLMCISSGTGHGLRVQDSRSGTVTMVPPTHTTVPRDPAGCVRCAEAWAPPRRDADANDALVALTSDSRYANRWAAGIK